MNSYVRYSKAYGSSIFIDFNVGLETLRKNDFSEGLESLRKNSMRSFCNMNYLKSSSKALACFRNSVKSTFIYLVLTNQPNLFPNSNVFEIDLTSFHLLEVTEFKMEFQNQNKR